MIEVCLIGAAGRMGQRTVALLAESSELALGSAVDTGAAVAGRSDLTANVDPAVRAADVVIDFSAPAACAEVAPRCAEHGVPYLVASTALTGSDREALARASERVPVLQAANLSVGINALASLVESAVALLHDFDVEIFEIHHKHKRDAPSGTAHQLADAARAGRPDLRTVPARSGAAVREQDELAVAAARGGDVSGEHTVYLLGEGERVELVHRATTPDIFARGALRAAAWLVGKPPGLYGMRDLVRTRS